MRRGRKRDVDSGERDLVSSKRTTATTKTTKNTKNGRRMVTAIAVAAGLLAAGGAGYRILADYLARPTDSVPMSSEELNRLPLQIGRWVGKNVPVDEAIVRATDSDAVINRTYSRAGLGRPQRRSPERPNRHAGHDRHRASRSGR